MRLVAALHYFGRQHFTDEIVNCAGEVGVSILQPDDVLQHVATSGLVPHSPVVADIASGCPAFQQHCTGFIPIVPGGVGDQGRLLSYGL